jgi:hypothetical protein
MVGYSMRLNTTVQTTYSTEQAAEKVEIAYITLRRWLAERSFETSVTIPIGGNKHIYRFTAGDIERLRTFKEATYCKGRGRPGRLREAVNKERNSKKALKRLLQWYGVWEAKPTVRKPKIRAH